MQPRISSYGAGARWFLDGWRIFRSAPIAWLGLVFTYWMLMTFVSLIPLAGIAAASVLVPAFSVGFMAAARAAERGEPVTVRLLFDGLQRDTRTQLLLGAVYFACLAAVLGATTLADDGLLARWMLSGHRPDEEALQSDSFYGALLVAGSLYLPVMMLFWFAPALAAWHGAGAAKALFFSFFACLMNWRAFIAYGAVTAAATIVLPFILVSGLLLVSGAGASLPAMGVLFPLLMVLLPTLFASFYASYRDIFGGEPMTPADESAKIGP